MTNEMKLRMIHKTEVVRTEVYEDFLGFAKLEIRFVNEREWTCQVGSMLIAGENCDIKAVLNTIINSIQDEVTTAKTMMESM